MSRFDDLSLAWLRSKPGVKWAGVDPDVLPLWVADMDFPLPEVVARALHRLVDGGDLGYPDLREGEPLEAPFLQRMADRHQWTPVPGRVRLFTDVLNALQAVLFLLTEPGDAVAFHAPTYPPFLQTFERMGLEARAVPLERTGTSWRFDLEEASRLVEGSKVVLVVNPHNPTGRMLTRSELESLVRIALDSGAILVSDEVHADLAYPGRHHLPTAAVSEEAARATVTLTSATKAFNLAGVRCAVAHVGQEGLWKALESLPDHLFGVVGNPGRVATRAAWEHGGPWLEEALGRLEGNRRRLSERLRRLAPEVVYLPPEAGYLAWLDFRGTGLGADPAGILLEQGRVQLTPGIDFGPEGSGFARLNFATSGPLLDAALLRIASVLGGG